MEKIKIEICCGTACYLLGAARLMELEGSLPADLAGCVEIEAKTCLGLCNDESLGGAPYVRINGEALSNATPDAVVARVREISGLKDL